MEPAPSARLIVVSDRDHRFIDLGDAEVGVGRAPENVIVVKDDMVSRRHCVIERAASGWRVRDLRSFNGTYLNGERVTDQGLRPWDAVRVGRTRIFYVERGAGGAAAPVVTDPTPRIALADAPREEGANPMGQTKEVALAGAAALLQDPTIRATIEETLRRERLEIERQVARRLRDDSAPATTPVVGSLSVRARRLGPLDGGGDFYDAVVDEREPDGLYVAVGTVSGQGIAASIASSAARHAFRGVVLGGAKGDVLDRLTVLRDVLARTLHPGTAVSLALARAQEDGRARVAATGGAGALILRAEKGTTEILRGVGRRDEAALRVEAVEVALDKGDRLLLASDGAGSLRAPGGGEPFGEQKLEAAFKGAASLGPGEMLGKLVDALAAHGGGSADRDATLALVLRS